VRIDKYIASVTDYSRAEVKRFIKDGEVCINACLATSPKQHIDQGEDSIRLHDQSLGVLAPRYFMLNKPPNTLCATTDNEQPTVIDLLDEPNHHKLHIAGRLDKDTTGLVLITDDGQWNHRLTAPNKDCFKTYRVTLAEPLSNAAVQQLEQGVQLNNEKQLTLPAKVVQIEKTLIELSIQEGKYHQVKRMLAAVNNHVTHLHRQQIGHILLDPSLHVGEYRALTASEIHGTVENG
jgi:16S rRNA pseudouridine516 synthase